VWYVYACVWCGVCGLCAEEGPTGSKCHKIMKRSHAYTSLMEIIPEAFHRCTRAFIIVINSLDSSDNMLTNNALYPWGTSIGKDKHGLSIGLTIGSVKIKHERNAIMQHQPVFKLHPVRLPVEPSLGYVCMCVHVRGVCVYVCGWVCACVWCVCVHVCACVCTYVCMCVHVRGVCVHVCGWVCAHVWCVCVCVHMCVYVCACVWHL